MSVEKPLKKSTVTVFFSPENSFEYEQPYLTDVIHPSPCITMQHAN